MMVLPDSFPVAERSWVQLWMRTPSWRLLISGTRVKLPQYSEYKVPRQRQMQSIAVKCDGWKKFIFSESRAELREFGH